MKILLPCTLTLLTAISATAQTTYQWNGSLDSNWQTAGNWQAPAGQPGFNTSVNGRLNIDSGVNNPLIYTAAEGTTIFAGGGSVRGLVINTGQMTITGGSFSTVGSLAGDVIGNTGTGSLTVNGGSYTANTVVTALGGFGAAGNGTLTLTSGAVTLNGAGSVLRLGSIATSTATVNLDGGTLSATGVTAVAGEGVKTFNFNGGVLQARANNGIFFASTSGVTANVKAGGAKIDSNGFNVTMSQALVHDAALGATRDGGLAKSGAGILTLSGLNTYEGNTVVSAGTLLLADNAQMKFVYKAADAGFNSLSGAGALTLDGDFVFDLIGAAPGTYDIVSTAGTTTFSGSFAVVGWTATTGTLWTEAGGSTFDETTGLLTVVPEPGAASLVILAGAFLATRRRSSGPAR
jgi:autotransporter-associated beta strand protein